MASVQRLCCLRRPTHEQVWCLGPAAAPRRQRRPRDTRSPSLPTPSQIPGRSHGRAGAPRLQAGDQPALSARWLGGWVVGWVGGLQAERNGWVRCCPAMLRLLLSGSVCFGWCEGRRAVAPRRQQRSDPQPAVPAPGSETPAFRWKDYAPRVFQRLRQGFGIDNRWPAGTGEGAQHERRWGSLASRGGGHVTTVEGRGGRGGL